MQFSHHLLIAKLFAEAMKTTGTNVKGTQLIMILVTVNNAIYTGTGCERLWYNLFAHFIQLKLNLRNEKLVSFTFNWNKAPLKIANHFQDNSIVILDAIYVYKFVYVFFFCCSFLFLLKLTALHLMGFFFFSLRSHKNFNVFDYCSELLTSIINTIGVRISCVYAMGFWFPLACCDFVYTSNECGQRCGFTITGLFHC